jgi:glutamate decarboxylase
MDSLRLINAGRPKKIASTLGYIRKLFIMPDSSDKFVEFGVHLLDLIHDFFQEKKGIHSSISMEELGELFNTIDIPEAPARIKDVLDDIKRTVIKHSVKVSNPCYIGHMTSAIPYFMILLEMIVVSLNQNQVKIETAKASSFVEREFLSWIHRLVFQKPADFYARTIQNHRLALGNVTADGTIANLTALALAIAKAFPPDGAAFKGVRREGLARALQHYGCRQAVLLVSKRGHYSLLKACSLLGLGTDSAVSIPVHPCTNRINLERLQETLDRIGAEDRAVGARTKYVALIGIAGTTETGSVDDLESLARIARDIGAHYHVDAAWGGGALLMDGGHALLRGIASADSVTFDAHKLLYAPNAMGLCLFNNPHDSRELYHTSNYIIRQGSVDQGRFTIEGSRPFACLKPWAAMKIMGAGGYRTLFEHARTLQNHFIRLLRDDPLFELLNEPELFIINYRFVPRELRAELDRLMHETKKNAAKVTAINKVINRLTIQLHKTVREHDMSFVSRTILESTCYAPRKIVVLRAVTVNPLTDTQTLENILAEHRMLGIRLWQQMRASAHGTAVPENPDTPDA